MRKLLKLMGERLSAGEDLVLVTVVASSGATPRGAGARMLVGRDGRLYGTIGGGAVEYRSEHIAQDVLYGTYSYLIGAAQLFSGWKTAPIGKPPRYDQGCKRTVETAVECLSFQNGSSREMLILV